MRAPHQNSGKLLAPLATSATPIVIRHSGARIAGPPWPAPEGKGLMGIDIPEEKIPALFQTKSPELSA
jgi:hypothetical protein